MSKIFLIILFLEIIGSAQECSEFDKIEFFYNKGDHSKALGMMLKDTACIKNTNKNWLIFLINKDDTLNLKRLLEMGYSPNYDDGSRSGRIALHSTCFFKQLEYTLILLKHGADINHKDANGETPFMEAIRHGYDFCEPLFKYKPEINITDRNGNTPLIEACKWNKTELAIRLINEGAKINIQNNDGISPLMAAVANNNYKLTQILLSKGADIRLKDKYKNGILFFAIEKGSIDIVKLLISKGATINDTNSYRTTLLLSAVYYERKDLVDFFINKGLDINFKNNNGITPFIATSYNSTPEIAELLIQNGADIRSKDNYGRNALDKAIENKNEIMIKYFRKLGLTERDFYCGLTYSQVEEIIKNNEIDKIKKFTKGQADTFFSEGEATPMHIAAFLSNISAMKVLVSKGANPNPINGYGITPLKLCIKNKNMECIDFLLGLNIDINKTLGHYHVESAIYDAIRTNDVRIVKKLLDYGADVNRVNYDDVSPLDIATCKCSKEIIKMIFEKTNKELLENPNKESPQDYAKNYCDNEENAIYIKSLIEAKYGKDITKSNDMKSRK